MYMDSIADQAFDEKAAEHASPCHFWCNLTQTVVGQDDRPAHKESCNSSRRCFED
ncbi:MAG: hypothetical protein JWR19_289 [Pedosphaera sp.]|nr:hypothetical protein [Pedosphaera sp.]